nr:tol-pal system protein YbgF [Verticiella sediminum]
MSFATRLMAGAALVAAGLAAQPAQAQLFGGDDEARQAIIKLRQELADVRSEDQRGRLALAAQIEQLQQQMSQMRGQLETLSKQIADTQQAQRQLSLDMTEQPPAAGGPGQPEAANLLAAGGEEQTSYDAAIDYFRKGQYRESATALQAFVQKFPQSTYAPTAQFYWGSSLYALKDYKSAISRLQGVLQNWPDNARAPDALLVIAGSQIELNDRNAARATLQRIIKDYPGSQAANTARDRLQLLQ